LLNIDGILKSKEVKKPFSHYIVDDVLDLDVSNLDNFDEGFYHSLMDEFNSYQKVILDTFKPIRLEQHNKSGYHLSSHIGLRKTKPNTTREVHGDSQNKIWSLVVYLSPEVNTGTELFTDEWEYHSTVEWKVNRGLFFSPGPTGSLREKKKLKSNKGIKKMDYNTLHRISNNFDLPRITLLMNIYLLPLDELERMERWELHQWEKGI
tara:strand:+ start:1123 stop:1743 length:621 start_codon:yes stop_codon:yes gene_type:complete